MTIAATWALFKRTAGEGLTPPGPWLDSGVRGDSREDVARQWNAWGDTDWMDSDIRLVAIDAPSATRSPTFNHTRSDGPFDPCDGCLELMSRDDLLALVKDMRETEAIRVLDAKEARR